MDWNHTGRARVTIAICVTLHTESMDWNFELTIQFLQLLKLLSTRRVWIEIEENIIYNKQPSGYSPHGEYGLKSVCDDLKKVMLRLLSTRRVWIEIFDVNRAELWYTGYSPHGEYGLKSLMSTGLNSDTLVTLHTESMDWNLCDVFAYYCYILLLSTRRVWIEITLLDALSAYSNRLLSTRRVWIEIWIIRHILKQN